ncbi:hypothetical protein AAVH_31809 [Aphelenchoides avenae]|nr:hypothetical protein AAVH_31809 [Aphelenchus avenae]
MSKASNISMGFLRDKKLIAYKSQKHQRLFKFVRAGSGLSSLNKTAFDYYCLGCWIGHKKECRVTVHTWTQEFIITDPDRTSSGRHACTQASSARPMRSHAAAKEPPPGERRHICDEDYVKKLLDDEGDTCEDRGEPSSKRMRDATQGSPSGHNDSILTQTVDGSRADMRPNDDSDRTPTDQRAGAQAELSHPRDFAIDPATAKRVCEASACARSDESSRQGDVDVDPAVDALGEALQHTESTQSASSAAQHAIGSHADTPHQSDVTVSTMQLIVEDEQKPQGQQQPSTTALKANATRRFTGCIASTGTKERRVGSPVEVKPTRKRPALVFTIDDWDEDTDDQDTSSSTCRASKKRVKGESVENNDAERLREGPEARFNRFLQEFGFWNEYSRYSFDNQGKPTDFVQLRHVGEKWIQFNNRN